jgi:acetyl esterase/lipase
MMKHVLLSMVLLVGLPGTFTSAFGGPLRDRIEERLESRRAAAQAEDTGEIDPAEQSTTAVRLPPDARLERDLPYGTDPQQRLDVYLPAQSKGAPILCMVHGGAWMIGDKAASGFVSNKVAHWLPKG